MKKIKGFTLIEILVTVFILGILVALMIPRIMDAIQKSKQKGTMSDMNTISKALTDYVTDNGFLPDQNGVMDSSFVSMISVLYLKVVPLRDQWGGDLLVYTGSNVITAVPNASPSNMSMDDFAVVSFGRNMQPDGYTQYDPDNPDLKDVFFETDNLSSYNQDLVVWNGSWVHAPKTARLGSGS